jgi:hypothetical protein
MAVERDFQHGGTITPKTKSGCSYTDIADCLASNNSIEAKNIEGLGLEFALLHSAISSF